MKQLAFSVDSGPGDLPLGLLSAQSFPVVTREGFAHATGLTAPTVYSMCDRGYLPTIRFGRRVFVNLEALRLKAIEAAQQVAA